MHDDDRPNAAPPRRRGGAGTAGGILVALAALAAKFKAILAFLFTFKYLLFAGKLALSSSSLLVSVWLYALFWGWKFAVAFVALLVVHELGHYVTLRNFGIPASLPVFVPGFGAFVASPLSNDPARNAMAAIMGPVFGIGGSLICWGYGLATHEPFWLAAAYVGFFLNLFNLIPAHPLDGGRVAGAIDGRLWLLGAVLIVVWILGFRHFSMFTLLILLFVLGSSIPRALAAFRGQVDPRMQLVSSGQRVTLALGYFVLLAIAGAGAAETNIAPPHHTTQVGARAPLSGLRPPAA
ncbi:MAG: site-2 protease family protein [Candidatus Eremiobacteraeota bacterium]|nr:site-2 protease family protein [Candidatus Eremiobacteraeota bacterium]